MLTVRPGRFSVRLGRLTVRPRKLKLRVGIWTVRLGIETSRAGRYRVRSSLFSNLASSSPPAGPHLGGAPRTLAPYIVVVKRRTSTFCGYPHLWTSCVGGCAMLCSRMLRHAHRHRH